MTAKHLKRARDPVQLGKLIGDHPHRPNRRSRTGARRSRQGPRPPSHWAAKAALRAIAQLTGISRTTLIELLEDAGEAFSEYQDRTLMNLKTRRVHVDEAWAFNYCKQKNVPTAKKAPKDAGDIWTWVGLDAESKLAVSWYIGGRDSEAAMIFMDDLAKRLANRAQLTSDGHKAYLEAVEGAFGSNIDYAMLVKV